MSQVVLGILSLFLASQWSTVCLLAQQETPAPPALPQRSTNPALFATVTELPPGSGSDPRKLTRTSAEVDNQSVIHIDFDEDRMTKGSAKNHAVEIRVEIFLIRDATVSRVAPLDNYLSGNGDSITYHDRPYNPSSMLTVVPDTYFNLRRLNLETGDQIEIRITNRSTQESLVKLLSPRPFGFNIRVADSLLLLKRISVSNEDREEGVAAFNFGPAPGVTYSGVFLHRDNRFVRFLRPGIGFNVSFTDWDDPALDIATGKFAKGTKSNDVEIGMGILVSFFDNALQLSYGFNLHVEKRRQYVGVGVSFVNISSRVSSLLEQ